MSSIQAYSLVQNYWLFPLDFIACRVTVYEGPGQKYRPFSGRTPNFHNYRVSIL
jgi:hypothetical protein